MIMRRGGERHEWIINCFYVGFDYQFELFTLRAISVIRRELFLLIRRPNYLLATSVLHMLRYF